MDPREEEFWVRSGTKTARNLLAWHGSAQRLKRAADLLRAQWKTDLLQLYRRMLSGPFPESVGGPMMLLAGLAIENLVKGLLIARNPSEVAGLRGQPRTTRARLLCPTPLCAAMRRGCCVAVG